jgi:hypothetical protein
MRTISDDRLDPYGRTLKRRDATRGASAWVQAAGYLDLLGAMLCGVAVAGLCLAGAAGADVGSLGRQLALVLVSLGAALGKAGSGLLEGRARWLHVAAVTILGVAAALALRAVPARAAVAAVTVAFAALPFIPRTVR